MKTDLLASELITNPSKEANTLYKQYHTTSSTLIDKHAPPHTKHTKAKYIPGLINKTVIATKIQNKSTFNRSQHMQKVHQYNRICMPKSKLGFYVPFNSKGHIGTGPQNCHLWDSNPQR